MSIAHPIVRPSQMRHPLVCQHISDEVKAKIKASWYNENPKTEKERVFDKSCGYPEKGGTG